MKKSFWFFAAAALMAGLAHGQQPSAAEREDQLAFIVAAARADGNLVSDAAMLRLLVFQQDIGRSANADPREMSERERILHAEADLLRERLTARVTVAEMDSVELLARGLGCYDQRASPEQCEQRKQRLAELAGDNAYYHLTLMAYAWQAGDSDAFIHHVRAGAAAGNYRSPYADYYAALHSRFGQVPDHVAPSLPAEAEGVPRAALMAMSLSAAYAMPPFQGFSAPCREAEGELRDQCLAIALMQLASSQTPIEVSIAAAVVYALGNGEERGLAEQKRRTAFWLAEKASELHRLANEGQFVAGARAYFEDYGSKGELEAARIFLVANNVPGSPPAGWESMLTRSFGNP
jgi:hypothetical protein